MPERASAGVYAGVRVVELATGLAAPYTAMFLADNGADVVKIEPPDGDPYRADPGFQTVNRNKRSVVVDDEDLRRALVAVADVVIIDRPGQVPSIREINPSAVVLSMPPWGERGPKVDDPSTAAILHAATGISWNQQSYGEVPVDVVVPIAHYGTGVLGALAASAGLFARLVAGGPVTYEVSEVAGAAAIQLGDGQPAGEPEIRPGDSTMGSKGRVACYRLAEAGDGRWLFLACGTARFYERLLAVIGREDLLDDPALANPPWGLMLDPAIERFTPILDEVFATKPRAEWLRILADADVPAQPVLTRDEFLATSIVEANEMVVTVDHPELGPVDMMGLPFTIESAPGAIRSPAPALGADTEAVLDDWLRAESTGRSTSPAKPAPPIEWAALHSGGGDGRQQASTAEGEAEAGAGVSAGWQPLAGLRVVDLASFIAGPVVSRHLAMLGAEVIKVEPPTGDPFRAIGLPFESWNQGKRSVVLDLRTVEGRASLHRLATTADAVIENFRPGVAKRLGADRDTLRAINPSLVFLSSPGYGVDESMADRPAFDPLVQALGGLMAAQGGLEVDDDGEPNGAEPVFLSIPIHDVVTPMLGALGLVAGLWQRARTGDGQDVRTSLAASTMVAQAAEFTNFDSRPAAALGGFDFQGSDRSTWFDDEDEPMWRDGDIEVPICRVGLTGSELAEANGLTTECDHAQLGPVIVFGQLIGGAGPAPSQAPQLDADGDAIRAELASLPTPNPDPMPAPSAVQEDHT